MPIVPTVADRHNNPLNIKYGAGTKRHVDEGRASIGEAAQDGGNFLRFNSAEDGFTAGRELLQSPRYSGLTVEKAMRDWSNKGYGADVVGLSPTLLMAQLSPEQRENLIQAMAKREGFGNSPPQLFGGVISGSSSTAPLDESWETALENMGRQDAMRLGLSLQIGGKQAPDQAAEVQQLSRQTGVPPDVVSRNIDQVRQQAQKQDFETFLKDAPKLAGWLKDPKNMAVAQDDLPQLGVLERLFNGARALGAGVYSTVPGVLGLLEGVSRLPNFPVEGPAGMEIDYEELTRKPNSYVSSQTRILEDRRRMTEAALETIRGKQAGAGPIERAVYSGIESIGAVTSLVPLGPAGVLGGMGASTAGRSIAEAQDQAVHPAVALAYGSLDGAVEVGTELLPVGFLYKQLEGGKLLKSLALQLATEIPGEQAATALQDLNAWAVLPENETKTFRDYLNERPGAATETLVATLVGTLGQAGVARVASRVFEKKEPEQAFFDQLGTAVTNSKTHDRLPDALQGLVSEMAKDGPLEHVYAPLDTWQTYWQTKGADPRVVAQELGVGAVYDQAIATGADIEIPIAAYAAKLAGTEHNAFFAKELRFDPDQMNARESEAFEAQEVSAEPEGNSEESEGNSAAKIESDLTGQMQGMGYSSREIESHSKFIASVFENLAQRYGGDAFQIYEPYRLVINRPIPELLKKLPNADPVLDTLIDRLRTGATPTQSEMFGTSLVEFIRQSGGLIDEQGELAARDVDEERKPFQKNLIQEQGLALDAAREKAAEAGYLPEEASVNDFIDLLDRELRGQPVFSQRSHNQEAIEQSVVLEQLSEYLKSRDVDLGAVSNEQVRKLLQEAGTAGNPAFGQDLGQDTLGSLAIGQNREMTISLFEKADLSTLLHEFGHLGLEVFGDIAEDLKTRPGELNPQQAQLVADYDAVLKHLGVASREQIDREQHELFARTWEAYLREGKAPNPELRSIFARFSAWLKAIYRNLRDLNAPLNPEISAIFDRMIASDEQIEQAEQEAQLEALLDNQQLQEDLKLSPEEMAVYGKTVQRAREKRQEELSREFLDEYFRTQQEGYQKKREAVRAQVAAEVHKQRGYIALSFLSKGTLPDGSPLPNGIEGRKLDGASLEAQYGKYKDSSVMKELRNLRVYSRENGISQDAAAELLGYSSGDELVKALVNLRPMDPLIDALTDDQMRMEFGDIRTDGTAAEKAKDAVMKSHSDVLQAELRALSKKARELAPAVKLGRQQERQAQREGYYVPNTAALQRIAQSRVAQLKTRELRPGLYWSAARRAGITAQDKALEGKYGEAFQWKLKQALNLEMYRAVKDAQLDVTRMRGYFGSLTEPKVRARIGKAGESYLEQIDGILERYSFKPVSLKEADKRSALKDWIAAREAEFLPVDLPETILNEARKVDWRNVPLAELRGVEDSVKHIAHLARESLKAQKGRDRVLREEMEAELVPQILGSGKGGKPRLSRSKSQMDKAKQFGKSLGGAFLHPDTILEELDGGTIMGPAYQYFKAAIDRGVVDTLLPREQEAAKRLAEIDSVYKRGELTRKFFIPKLGDSLTREEMLSIALNWGTEDNREAMLGSRLSEAVGFNAEAAAAVFDQLDARDAAYIRSVWAYLNEFWPEIASSEKRRKGIEPEKVAASTDPLLNKLSERTGVPLSGGYYPLKYDGSVSILATEDSIEDKVQSLRMGRFVTKQTRAGFRKERVGSGGRPVLLSLNVIPQHVHEVLYDLSLGDAVRETSRALNNRKVKQAFEDAGSIDAWTALELWLGDVAAGELISSDGVSRILRGARSGLTASSMMLNAGTTILQFTGIAQTAAELGTTYTLKGLMDLKTAPWWGEGNLFEQVRKESSFMARRGDTWNKDLMTAMEGADKGIVPLWVWQAGYWGIAKAQQAVDMVTYLGARRRGLDQFDGDERKAIDFAERMVARSQSSGLFSDRAGVERGTINRRVRQTEAVRIFSTLGSYMLTKGNIAYRKTKATNFRSPTQVAKWMADMSVLIAVEAILVGLLRGSFDDDEGPADWAWTALKESGLSVLGMFPVVREFGSELQGFKGGGALGSATRVLAAPFIQAEQGELDRAAVKSVVSAGGLLLKAPSTQINRTLDAAWREAEGEDVSLLDFLVYRVK